MTVPPDQLIPGYSHRIKGASSYSGVLRAGRKDVPLWTCAHDHLGASTAVVCARAEKERRVQGAREVMVLLHCEPCGLYFGGKGWEASGRIGECPYCDVPLSWVKVLVLERPES